jgi:hypothetical protein
VGSHIRSKNYTSAIIADSINLQEKTQIIDYFLKNEHLHSLSITSSVGYQFDFNKIDLVLIINSEPYQDSKSLIRFKEIASRTWKVVNVFVGNNEKRASFENLIPYLREIEKEDIKFISDEILKEIMKE